MFGKPQLVLVHLLVFLTVVWAAPTTVYVRTPAGDTVPHTLLSPSLPDVPVHEFQNRLHYLTPDLKLISQRSKIDLNKALRKPRKIQRQNTLVYVNGERSIESPVGYVRRGNGFSLTSAQDGSVISVRVPGMLLQPVQLKSHPNLFVDVRSDNETITFGDDELTVPDIEDATIGDGSVIPVENAEPSCAGAGAPPQYVEMAVAADSALCTRYGSAAATETAILTMISNGEAIYAQSMCIRFTIAVLDIQCDPATDPYVGLTDPLDGFKAVWQTLPASSVPRDVVLFVTGVNFLDNIAGQAYVGTTCFLAYSYMWVDLMNELIFAHEMGHNLNATHTTEGLMKPSINLGTDNFFSQVSIDQIVTFVDAETSRSICIEGAAITPSPTPAPSSSSQPSPSASPAAAPSATSTPTATPSSPPTGPGTCDTRLLQRQSMECTGPGSAYTVDVPISFGGASGTLTLDTYLEQRFGFAFGVSTANRINIGEKKNKIRLSVSVTNVQVLASFDSVTQSEVASQNNPSTITDTLYTSFFYPGPLDVPEGISSCCGQTMKVSALTTVRLTGSGIDSEVLVFVVRDTIMQCVQFGSCSLGFTAMSNSVECPICQN